MKGIQYTLRRVPSRVDERLRALAARSGRSLNEVALEALAHGSGIGSESAQHTDLDRFCGTWQEDPDFDRAVQAFETIEPDLWR